MGRLSGRACIAMLLAMLLLTSVLHAEEPVIPAWAGQQTALTMVFVPNGDICVLGPFGAVPEDAAPGEGFKHAIRERWYRYSHEGELLGVSEVYGQGLDRGCWMFLYWPGLQDRIREMAAAGHTAHMRCGSVSFGPSRSVSGKPAELAWNNPQPPEITAADIVASYDYLGNELAPADVWDREESSYRFPFMLMNQSIDTYRRQLEEGIADPASVSPFEGKGNGPVRAAPGYRPPDVNVFQYSIYGVKKDYIRPLTVIRSLDDPSNPYRGQYSRWDRLCFAYRHGVDPQIIERFEQQEAALHASVEAAREEGLSYEEFMEQHGEDGIGIGDAELVSEGYVRLSNYVNADGFMLPQMESQRLFQSVNDKQLEYARLDEFHHVLRLNCRVRVSPQELAEWQRYDESLKW